MRYLLSFSLILFMSCNCFKKQETASAKAAISTVSLAGTSWVLASITGFDLEQTNKPVTLQFSGNDKIGGNAGCNQYGGNYSLEGSHVSFSHIMATKMACMPGMKTEIKFMEVLHHADEVVLSGDKLSLSKSGKTLAEFSRQQAD
jgi:heat shock protein HslJ